MGAVATALGTMAAIGVAGWLIGRYRWLGAGAETVLARTVFAVATPALLLVTIARADLHLLASRTALTIAISTLVVAGVALAVARGLWHLAAGEATVVTLASSYVNAGNLGLPLAVYLLGDATAVVPTLLFQLLVLAPIAFVVLDSRRPGADDRADDAAVGVGAVHTGARGVLGRTLRNPIIIATLTGLVLSGLPWEVPDVVLEPFRLVGAAAAPLALLTFGMSLAVPRPAGGRPGGRRELVLAVSLRSVVHPLLAAGVGRLLGLEGPELLAVVTMAALPTAQNVLVYALQYGRGQAVARDAGLVTTLLAVPVMLAVAATLA
ncbi:AEC family transporter [Cellulomonas sp. ATA003]|uniref:AEC family transporter n=1 Tax=Cellulomonas sp. ATA003 TaxID=3073064 RepID=UPI00287333A5|nr:AEC family transporter [Cellulomonas sp. ATA003]WNB85907.1 AEC family transporter [Cellulomonas sp. ATA003]